MAVLSNAFRIPIATPAAPALMFDVRTGPTSRPTLRDITITSDFFTTNTTITWGCGRNGTLGVLQTNDLAFLPEDGASRIGVVIGLDWSVVPTAPTNYLRRYTNRPSTLGGLSFVFAFNELVLEPSTSFGFWALAIGNLESIDLNQFHVSVNVDL